MATLGHMLGATKTTDSYGYPVSELIKRHKDCRCEVPCQGRFECTASGHKGDRGTPYCNGMGDSEECDTCWWRTEKKKAKKKARSKAKAKARKKPKTKKKVRGKKVRGGGGA